MQMGRWFGYRRDYEMLPRVWVEQATIDRFRFMALVEQDFREEIFRFSMNGDTFDEFGPRILNSPNLRWLRLTSAQKNGHRVEEIEVDFSGAREHMVKFENES